jgi:hypothetical protein
MNEFISFFYGVMWGSILTLIIIILWYIGEGD